MSMVRRDSSSRESGISADKWLKTRKETKSPDNRKYAFLDSSSEDDSFSSSHFMKKSAKKEVAKVEKDAKPHVKPETEMRPKTSRGDGSKPTSSMSRFTDVNTKIKMLEEKIRSRQKGNFNVMSSSDMDLDVSSDSEIKRDVRQIREERKASVESAHRKKFSYLETSSEDESTRLNFLKQESNTVVDLDSIIRPSTPSKKKSVSFASNLVHSSSSPLEVSLDEFLPSQHSDLESNSLDDFMPMSKLQQVMSLDDLMPADATENNGPSRFSSDLLELQSVNELIPSYKEDDFTEDSTTTSSSPNHFASNVFNVYSVDELDAAIPEDIHKIPEEIKAAPKPLFNNQTSVFKSSPAQSSFKPKQEKVSEPLEVDEYSSDFQSDDTLKETASIVEDISEEIKTESEIASSIHTEESQSYSKSSKTSVSSYTESFESETSVSSVTSVPKVKKVQKPATKQCETAVQTEPVKIESETAFSRLNQTFFKPSSLVSNETLAILTTYSPAVLAVQDILKQQYIHTKEFIKRSEKFHESAARSLVADYQYSSLEEAREIINKQRQKLNLPPRTWTYL